MRSVEEQIEIPESRKNDFREEIFASVSHFAVDGRKFGSTSNIRLRAALAGKAFSDARVPQRLKEFVQDAMSPTLAESVSMVRDRMVNRFGYDPKDAQWAIERVASRAVKKLTLYSD